MPKFKLLDAFVKPTLSERRADPKGTKWPSMGHLEQQKDDARKVKAARLRARFWDENGEFLCRNIVRFTRAVSI